MEYRCPECGWQAPTETWKEIYVDCETCGDHPAVQCKQCKAVFDLVWNEPKLLPEKPR